MLGFYVSGHPLAKYASRLQDLKTVSLGEVEGQRNGKEISVAALIVGVRPMRSRRGARWAIYTIQDMTGIQELLAFPESFTKLENILKPRTPLLLKVRVQLEESGTRLSLQEARCLEEIAEPQTASSLRIRMNLEEVSEGLLDRLQGIFVSYPGANPVTFDLSSPDGTEAALESQRQVQLSSELLEAIRGLCGEDSVGLVM
jgi:DNA polymerase III subunit alpha